MKAKDEKECIICNRVYLKKDMVETENSEETLEWYCKDCYMLPDEKLLKILKKRRRLAGVEGGGFERSEGVKKGRGGLKNE